MTTSKLLDLLAFHLHNWGAPMPSEFTLLSKVLATHLFVNPVSDLPILVKCTRFCSTTSILANGETKSRLQCFVFLRHSSAPLPLQLAKLREKLSIHFL